MVQHRRAVQSGGQADATNVVKRTLSELAMHAKKPVIVFFDEVDCLCRRSKIT